MDLNFPDFLLNETVQNDNLNPADLTQNYFLLKKKICETHEVIKQYNDKLKECERMKSDLDSMSKQVKKVTCSYNSTLAKITKLEIQNKTYKDNITTLTTQVNDHKIKAAADQQYIQQLICKIKDVENQSNDKVMQYDSKNSSSEMKIKELETELKTIKKTYETKIKKLEKKSPAENNNCHSNSNNIITKNVATNTCGNSNNSITKDVATNTCGNSNNTITKNVATNTCGNSDNTITKNVATNTCGNSDNVITKNVSTNTTSNETIDVGTITVLTKNDIMIKSQVTDKCVLTDEFYSTNDMYPIFCAKCEVHMDPPPIDKICKVMMESCPNLLENISSPPKTPALVRSAMTNGYSNTENLIALPETNPPHFHAEREITRSTFTSPNLPAPMPLNHIDCHNFSQPPNLLRSTPIRASLANTTTASQTDRCEDKRIDECSQSQISSLVDKLEKKQRKKIKRLKKKMKELESQKSSTCCQQSHPSSSHMSDTNNTAVQLNLLELLKSLIDKHQVKEKEPVVEYKPRDKTRKKSRLSRPKPTKRLQSVYSGNSWKAESVSKKAEKSSARKRPKKRKHKHSMLLKKSDVSVNNSEHLEEPASDSDSSSYHNLFDTTITDQDVSNEQNDSSCEEAVNETCNDVMKSLTNSSAHSTDMDEPETVDETCDDVIKPLTHSSAHSTDMDEPETVDRVKNSVEFTKSMNGETDSGIHSDSVESSKLAQYEPDLDSCFLSKSNRNARNKVAVKSASSFAGNFKSNRSCSTEKSPTNEDDGKDEDETETPKTNGELEISESIPKNVTVTRKRKFGELEKPSHRLELMKKLRRLKKKPIKYQKYSRLNITEEAAYSESQKEDEKKQPEQEVETVENDYVPKKKGRIAHTSKVAKKANISLNSCAQAGNSLVKTLEDKNVKPQTTIVNKTEADTSIVEETPVQTIAKEDTEKLADTSNSKAMEDVCPLYSESQKDEKKQLEQEVETVENDYVPKKKGRIAHTPKVAKKANISLNNCAEARTSLFKTLEDENVKPQTTIVNKTVADTSIGEEANMTQETPVQTIAKEDNEKLSDTSNSEAVEDVCPLYSESQKEDEKKQPEQEVETVENDYVPKKKGRIAHTLKVARKANISLNSCAQARTSLVKTLEDKNVKPQTTIVNKTKADSGIVEETNMTQETPVETIAKEDNEKLADTSNSEAVEDLFPLSPDPESPDEMSGDERCDEPIVIPVEPVFDISALIEQSAESRKGLELNLPACKKSLIQTSNDTNDISALEEFEHREKGHEIDLSDETDDTTNYISSLIEHSKQKRKGQKINFSACTDHVYALSLESEQTQKGLEINFPVRNKPVIENDNIKNGSNAELRTNGRNQLKELPKSSSSQDNDSLCRVEEVVEDNKSFNSKHPWVLGEYRAKEMNYYRDIKLNSHSPVEILKRLNDENIFKSVHTKKKLKNLEHVRQTTDKFVRKELQRLVDSEWKSDVHRDVLGKLKTTCTPRIIAKNIVEYLSNEEESQQTLDKTYTPPAPLMTKSQQRITALLIDLEKEFPMIIKLVLSGIEFKIFNFNQKLYRHIMESLARIFTVLARVEKDRERVRIFCCDALYCLGRNATIVLYTVITSWPEVLPASDATKEYLPACIAHLILSMSAVDYPKLSALKSLVRIYYKYPLGTLSNEMIKNLSNAFEENCQGEVMASIMLLAKKEGTEWTYKNIVKAFLLPMIINNKCLSEYKAFCLLGTLMRPFPIEDSTEVDSTVEQLSELCNEVSDEQQEGVMSALMALSRHKFHVTLSHLLKWTPNSPLRDRTVDQIYGVYNQREPTFWTKCINRHKKRRT